jgi:hypothetical protein
MQWLQILVEQTPTKISLHVDDAVCEMPGPHKLSDEMILFFTGELGGELLWLKVLILFQDRFPDAILPPQSAAPVLSVQPYQVLFIGGVPRVQHERYPRAGMLRRERIAYYITSIPPILGCMRGFMLGEQLDLRTGGSRPNDQVGFLVKIYP